MISVFKVYLSFCPSRDGPDRHLRGGIVEYRVVSLSERTLTVHRQPIEGIYRDVTSYSETDSVSSLAAPGAALEVSRLLPPSI
jgi:hypothetical protein